MVSIDKFTLNEMARLLVALLKKEEFIHPNKIGHLQYFVNQKGEELDKEILHDLLKIAIENKKFHSEAFFRTIIVQILLYHKDFVLSDAAFTDQVMSIYTGKCPKCGHEHPTENLAYFGLICDKNLKDKLRSKVLNILSSKFDPDLYYIATIYELITYNSHLDYFINYIKPMPKMAGPSLLGAREEAHNYCLNQLIHIAYRFEINLGDIKFDKFKGCSDYYDWLLDMKNFDYKKFQAKWISEYPTKPYFDKMKEVRQIKESVQLALKERYNRLLAGYYFNNLI